MYTYTCTCICICTCTHTVCTLMIWLSYVIALDTSCHCLLVLGGVDIVELLVDTGGVVVVTEAHDFVRDDCCLKPTEKMYMYNVHARKVNHP